MIAAAFQKFYIWLERYTAAEMNERKQTSLGQFKVKCLKTEGFVGRTTDSPGEGRLSLRDGRTCREWDSHTQRQEASVHVHDGVKGWEWAMKPAPHPWLRQASLRVLITNADPIS